MSTGNSKKRGRTEGHEPALDAPIPDRRAENVQQPLLEAQTQPTLEVTPDANIGKQKVRGKTTLQVIPTGETKRQEIEWNENGQPVGLVSKRFSSTIGCLVREQVPINIDSWHGVGPDVKDELWKLLSTQKYTIDLTHKAFILQAMGRLWRAYKSELSAIIEKIVQSRRTKAETTRQLNLLRPTDVPEKEWDEFVKSRCSDAWKEKSEKMKAIRAKQLLPHTLSRLGYARLQHEHKQKTGKSLTRTEAYVKGHERKKTKNEQAETLLAEIKAKLDELPPSEGIVPIKYDALSQVLGKEKNGRVRGLGGGVTPSRVDAQIQTSSWKKALEDKLEENCERTKIIQEMLLNLTRNGGGGNVDTGGSGTKNDGGREGRSNHTIYSTAAAQEEAEIGEGRNNISPPTANSKSVQGSTRLVVNDQCKLLDWEGTDEVVATGRISAVDPATKVHGYKLGPDCYRVEVVEAVNPRAEFYRYQPEFSAMEDAVGSTIAWPIKYIVHQA